MSDYVRELEAELLRVGRQRQQRRIRPLRPGGSSVGWGGVLTGLGSVVVVAVVLAAIALPGHGQRPHLPVPSDRVSAGAGSLVAQLAVLRRHQTAADRAGTTALTNTIHHPAGPGMSIDPDLTRLLATLPPSETDARRQATHRQRAFVVVATPRDGEGTAFASVMLVTTARSGGPPRSVFFTRASAFPASGGDYDIAIVPDTVTRVRWTLENTIGKHHRRHPTTVYPTVRHNLASAAVNPRQGRVTRVTWYGAQGRILKTITGLERQATLAYRRPAPTQVPQAPPAGQPIAQVSLQPPAGHHHDPNGVATLSREAGVLTLHITAHHLPPNPKSNAYAIWVYRSPTQANLLGFITPDVRPNGTLTATGQIPAIASHDDRILITRQPTARAIHPGKIILEGELPHQ